jgi:hypothetical protein
MLSPMGHLLAASALTVEIVSRTLKFKFMAMSLRTPFALTTALRAVLGGDFAAGITPSRLAAEPTRFLVLHESKMRTTDAVLLLFSELFLEMASVFIVALACAMIFHGAGAIVGGVFIVAGLYAALVFVVGAAGYQLAHRKARGRVPRWARAVGINAGAWRGVQRWLRQLRTGMQALRGATPGMLTAAFLTSLLHVIARLAVLPLLLLSFGVRLPFAPIVLWPMALIFGGNAVPAPGGGGLVEVGFKAALGDLIPPTYFAATLIWWRFYTFYALIVLGALAAGRTVMRAVSSSEKRGTRAGRSAPQAGRPRGSTASSTSEDAPAT